MEGKNLCYKKINEKKAVCYVLFLEFVRRVSLTLQHTQYSKHSEHQLLCIVIW